MRKKLLIHNESGIAHVALFVAIAVVVAIAGVGVYISNKDQSKNGKSNAGTIARNNGKEKKDSSLDTYSGWKTASISSPKLSFRYPVDWTVTTSTDQRNVEVKSPPNNGHYFVISLISGKSQDINLNFLGKASGTTIAEFSVRSQKLYIVAQTDSGDSNMVTGLGLATTPGSASTSFGITDSQNTNNVTMVASLLPVAPSPDDSGVKYEMINYTNNPSYQSVLKVFKSLTGSLPGND